MTKIHQQTDWQACFQALATHPVYIQLKLNGDFDFHIDHEQANWILSDITEDSCVYVCRTLQYSEIQAIRLCKSDRPSDCSDEILDKVLNTLKEINGFEQTETKEYVTLTPMPTNKTLEQLENDYWEPPSNNSHLVTTCHELRKKPLSAFNTENLRIMIGQNIGLTHLLPLAFNTLNHNILAEGDFYEGDLLTAVLSIKTNYWIQNTNHKETILRLVERNFCTIEQSEALTEIKNQWLENIAKIKAL